ncbi:GNAT family N-acetyltransferase [Streptomyces uncialis]|uniref:GNAT family N-acetyltransferase n=1 Tax=Streptomyces uncialis TaxID=1048205 RepID=UPI002E35C584|nr:GNAT family N-acetyltransferase [Streptomyces uncialis]
MRDESTGTGAGTGTGTGTGDVVGVGAGAGAGAGGGEGRGAGADAAKGQWRVDEAPAPGLCAAVLAAAFATEPVSGWICGDSERARRHWFAATLATHATVPGARRHLLTDGTGQPVAAAVLTPPGAGPGAGAKAAWTVRTLLRCGPGPLIRTLRYLGGTAPAAPDGAWNLEFIGVLPHHTGRGAGRRLLDQLLATAPAPAPGGVHLTTADPDNVTIYERLGFTTHARLRIGPITTTAMWRPAAPQE